MGSAVIEWVELCYLGPLRHPNGTRSTKGSRRRVQPGAEMLGNDRGTKLATCRLESRKGSDNRSCWWWDALGEMLLLVTEPSGGRTCGWVPGCQSVRLAQSQSQAQQAQSRTRSRSGDLLGRKCHGEM